MTDLVKTETEIVDGWELSIGADGERRVRDVDVAARAGLARPRDVRAVIKSNILELEAHGEVCGRRPRTPGSLAKSGGRPALEYLLNEDQAVALVALLRTPKARELRIALVRLFGAVRRREVIAAPSTLPLDVAHSPCVGDVPNLRLDVAAMCQMTAKASSNSVQRIHGFVRKTYRVNSIYQVSVLAWPQVRLTMESLALGRIALPAPSRRALPPGNVRQLSLLPGGA